MNLALNAKVKKLIEQRVKAGKYSSPEDVVSAAVVNLDHQERFGEFAPGELDRLIREGDQSIRRDGLRDGHAAHKTRVQRRAQRRSAS